MFFDRTLFIFKIFFSPIFEHRNFYAYFYVDSYVYIDNHDYIVL